MISAIVAVDNNWGIGFNGDLLERIPADLKYFKELTTNNVVIMGKKTWDSLPKKPLPNRINLVITHDQKSFDEGVAFISLEEAITRLTHINADENWFVIGGGQIYRQLLPYCDSVYVTKIYREHENVDTYFPNLDESEEWICQGSTEILTYNNIEYRFLLYHRSE